jgi:hypothetical protein
MKIVQYAVGTIVGSMILMALFAGVVQGQFNIVLGL